MATDAQKRLKYAEWRPIGVCDTAPPGRQKAQMFTREDFLIVTGAGINRKNWERNQNVRRILDRYTAKLAKISSVTETMERPEVARISLVGTIMKLSLTPDLNRESKDGKLQLFRIEFEDRAVGNRDRLAIGRIGRKIWISLVAILSLLTIVVAAVLILTIGDRSFVQKRQYSIGLPSRSALAEEYCQNSLKKTLYLRHLSEMLRILQFRADDLYYQSRIGEKPVCIEEFRTADEMEGLFLKCMSTVREQGGFVGMPPGEYRKLSSCKSNLCRSENYLHDLLCL